MPARCCTWLPGSQHAPPEYAEVPPSLSVFSTTQTESPALAARAAPVSAPPPDPTTTTSYSCSVTVRWSQLERVLRKAVPTRSSHGGGRRGGLGSSSIT